MNPNTSGERTRISAGIINASHLKIGDFPARWEHLGGKDTEKSWNDLQFWPADQGHVSCLFISAVEDSTTQSATLVECVLHTLWGTSGGYGTRFWWCSIGGFSTDSRKLRESGASKSSPGVCSPDYGESSAKVISSQVHHLHSRNFAEVFSSTKSWCRMLDHFSIGSIQKWTVIPRKRPLSIYFNADNSW